MPKLNHWTMHSHRRTLILIWAVALLLLASTMLFVTRLVDEARMREVAAAQRDLSNLTRVAQEHANRTLRSADQVIRFVTERYLELGEKLDLGALSRAGVIDNEIFNQVGVINAQGILILSSQPFQPRLDLSDREHFKVHVASNTVGLFVSKPVLGRTTGRWSVQLTRRIIHKDGSFGGVVVVSLDPRYFTHFYGDLQLGRQGIFALFGLDGVARARKAGDKEDFGVSAIDAPMFSRMAQGELQGSYVGISRVDQVKRLYFFRRIPGYELAFSAGINLDDMLANHLQARKALYVQAGLLCLLVLALALGLTRYLGKLRHAVLERLIAQGQLQDRNEQLDAIFSLCPDGFVSFDRQGRVVYLNPAFSQMVLREDQRLEGMDEAQFSAFLSGRCAPGSSFLGVAKLRQRILEGNGDAHTILELSVRGKTVIQLSLRLSKSESVSQILYFRDVTHETEVDEMKSEFLTTAAHELRTPMASILGFSELLLEDRDPETQQEFLGIIHTQSKAMAIILDELLDLARIEARRGKDFEYAQIELRQLCSNIFKSLPVPGGRDLPRVCMAAEVVYVLADEGKLRQAIVNVLTNAYKYSPNGGPVLFGMELLQKEGQPGQVHMQVMDHGMGMSPDQASRIFERFYRADKSGNIPGSGLGMSLVQEIIKLHQGRIEVETSLGSGTCVHIYLPLGEPPNARPDSHGDSEAA